jgi:hypothetical protein
MLNCLLCRREADGLDNRNYKCCCMCHIPFDTDKRFDLVHILDQVSFQRLFFFVE